MSYLRNLPTKHEHLESLHSEHC